MSEADRQKSWEIAESILEYFDSYRLATVAPVAFEIEAALAAARAEGRREAIEECAKLVAHHPFAEDRGGFCLDSQGCCEEMEYEIRALLGPTAPAAPPESL